jgi:hypothetical protein
MNKKIRQAVFDRATPEDSSIPVCEGCGQEVATECHHAIGGNGKRKQHESVETCFALGNRCHSSIETKNGAELRRKLIMKAQENLYNLGLTEDQVREKMGGKLYTFFENT